MTFQVTERHKQSISFTLTNIFGSFLCVIALFSKQLFSNADLNISEVLGKGDVFIICASMSISAIYTFYEFKDNRRDWSSSYFIFSVMNYALSVIFYLIVIFIEKPSTTIIIFFSLAVFVINLVVTYASSYYSNLKADASIERAAQGKKLEDDLEKALKKG